MQNPKKSGHMTTREIPSSILSINGGGWRPFLGQDFSGKKNSKKIKFRNSLKINEKEKEFKKIFKKFKFVPEKKKFQKKG